MITFLLTHMSYLTTRFVAATRERKPLEAASIFVSFYDI